VAGTTTPDIASARGRVASLGRFAPGTPDYDDARRELRTRTLAKHIKKVVDAAPPLTQEQRDRLAELLRPVKAGGGGAA
jgi:hypothetical protein